MDNLILRYDKPAENSDYGWENQSLPVGNGYLGANIFGIVQKERVQITENSLENPGYTNIGMMGGLNNFAELYFYFDHENISDYQRGLDIENAIAYVNYTANGVKYTREYFASYPDKALVIKFTSSKSGALSFRISPEIPFIKDYAIQKNDGGGKSGTVTAENDKITLSGIMHFYQILFEGQLKIHSTNGIIKAKGSEIIIENADEAIIIFALGTNYRLDSSVFSEDNPKKKLAPVNPHEKVSGFIKSAIEKSYDELKAAHISDYRSLFGRVSVDIQGETADLPTDKLLSEYRKGADLTCLEILYFQYGRYLLICSSRKGCLPCNLQGIWNCHDISPWGSGYWHNINIQMNYWHAFNTNLAECFDAYVDYFKAFLPKAQELASEYIKTNNPENYFEGDGECGWAIGTGAYPYDIQAPCEHSGPGTGALTSKLFWDYYDFTRDFEILEEITYPALLGMSKFLTKTVKNYDGLFLTKISASPEQMLNGGFLPGGKYYATVGCAFDRQMIYENGRDFIKAAGILNIDNEAVRTQKIQIDSYNPVEIGLSGQIKEYSEECFYGEIGEYNHRHISQLVALCPGTIITSETDAYTDAAKFTLNERGDDTTGWALAHRLNAWARTGDADRAYKIFRTLLSEKTMDNLWDTHPPFQIDGNFGGSAGFCEMLLQSHEGFIHILPALPSAWKSGEFAGFAARGAFEISVQWENGSAKRISVISKKGGNAVIKYPKIASCAVFDHVGNAVEYRKIDEDKISFGTKAGNEYIISGIAPVIKTDKPENFHIDANAKTLKWDGQDGVAYNVYRAVESQPAYDLVAVTDEAFYRDNSIDFNDYSVIAYKVTAVKDGYQSDGAVLTVNHATELQKDRYINGIKSKL